jgi:hypothetical protein
VGPPVVGCPLLTVQYIRSHPPYLEDAPYRGERNHITGKFTGENKFKTRGEGKYLDLRRRK